MQLVASMLLAWLRAEWLQSLLLQPYQRSGRPSDLLLLLLLLAVVVVVVVTVLMQQQA